MKRVCVVLLCLLMIAGLCGCGQAPPANTPFDLNPHETNAYAEVLTAYRDEVWSDPYASESLRYSFYDIDGNGTKELLIGWYDEYNDTRLTNIYIIQNGVAVLQEMFYIVGEGGGLFPSKVFDNGVIRVDGSDDNGRGISFYRIEDGELKHQACLVCNINVFDWEEQVFNDEYFHSLKDEGEIPITKDEFDRLQKEYEGDGQVVELDWRPLR